MPDFRAFPLSYTAPFQSLFVVLELAEANMTVGNRYEMLGAAVDNAATPGPKPYALVADDNQHFRLVEFTKLKRFTPGTP